MQKEFLQETFLWWNCQNSKKVRILKAVREKKKGYNLQRSPIRLTTDFLLTETLQDRKGSNDTFKVLKEKNCQSRILCLAKLPSRYEGETETLSKKSWGSLSSLDLPCKKFCLAKNISSWNEKKLISDMKKMEGDNTLVKVNTQTLKTKSITRWCVNHLSVVQRFQEKSVKNSYNYYIC